MATVELTLETFENTIAKEGITFVDFWAEWCGPCKMVAPILEEIGKDYAGKLVVAKINVDENTNVPAKHGIRGIPTMILFKNGAVVAQKVGAAAKSQLTAWIDSQI